MSYLNNLDIDTVLIMGGTTSGYVCASVIDAFSYIFLSVSLKTVLLIEVK